MANISTDKITGNSRIQELPKDVVDRIAAGEVVQRPSSVIKELLENSLDADSSNICVTVEKGGLLKMSVSDNGSGIAKEDLQMAATRFATSKLRTVDDLNSIQSFGFRGEALASVSLVARLQIVSRRRNQVRAYRMEYRDGSPSGQATAIAGKEGTTVTVKDLFYNLKHRRKMNERDEYHHILHILQRYAVHHAARGVGIVLKTKTRGSDTVDLNTTSLLSVKALVPQGKGAGSTTEGSEDHSATRKVITHVFGSTAEKHLLRLHCQTDNRAKAIDDTLDVRYEAHGFITDISYEPIKASCELVLFVNNRLVESFALKKKMEGVYAEFTTKTKPLVYLSIEVPGNQVDVNVHPTKRQVALLHQDLLYDHVCTEIRKLLAGSAQMFCPSQTLTTEEANKKRRPVDAKASLPGAKRQKDPSRFVRTTMAAPAGALEPFLAPKSTPAEDTLKSAAKHKREEVQHMPGCEMPQSIDLSAPGAFAAAFCRCQDGQSNVNVSVRSRRQVVVRPTRVKPTDCAFHSIKSLRRRVQKAADKKLAKNLRNSTLVGVVNKRTCLVQCREELVLWNHHLMAQELFFQLALDRFCCPERALLGGGGVKIKKLMESALESEERLENHLDAKWQASETNSELAEQATNCLMSNAEMLAEYFSICIERSPSEDEVMLTALPILLEGHTPQPHALPLFLLRLATEVNWTEERPCFEGVCRELGSYYAEIPFTVEQVHSKTHDDRENGVSTVSNRKLVDSVAEQFVKHSLFPAISFLLVPPETFSSDRCISKLALLPSLYKIFERC